MRRVGGLAAAMVVVFLGAGCSADDSSDSSTSDSATSSQAPVAAAASAQATSAPSAASVPAAFIPPDDLSSAPADVPPSSTNALYAPNPSTNDPKKNPNILLIISDDMRPELGVYGSPIAKTPNIDALAQSGALFERAFVSEAQCAPSRATLLTSLRPDTTGITGYTDTLAAFAPNVPTIGDTFKAAGYQTFKIGKVPHVVTDNPKGWTTVISAPLEVPAENYLDYTTMRWPDRNTTTDFQNARKVVEAMPGLAKKNKPFLYAVGFLRPHLPLIVPIEDWNKYASGAFPAPINPGGQTGAFPWSLIDDEIFGYGDTKAFRPKMPASKGLEITWAYLAAISSVDVAVGELMKGLKDNKLDGDTIVVMLGDHGWKLGDHARWAKKSNADIDVRIPLIMRAPGRIAPNTRVKGIVETADILPTLAQMAGIPLIGPVQGASFARLFSTPAANWKSAAFTQFPRSNQETGGKGDMMGYSVRSANYRYTAWVRTADKVVAGRELYDLTNDPQESYNVANLPQYQSTVSTLENLRLGGWKAVQDTLPR